MKKMHIDFAPSSVARGVLRTSRAGWIMVSVLCVTAVSLAFVYASVARAERELALLQAQSQVRTQTPAAAAAAAAAAVRAPVPEAEANAVNAAVLQLNLPWRDLHDAVQAGTPANIALLALEPDARKNTVRITAEAKSSDDMIAYVERLQKVEWFSAVTLARHEINEQDPNRPIRFQLDAQWRGPQ